MIAGGTTGNSRSQSTPGDARPPAGGTSPDAHLHADAASSFPPPHRARASESTPATPPPSRPAIGRGVSESLKSAFAHVLEGADHFHTLLQVRADRTRLSLRRWVTIGFVGLLAAMTLVPVILGGVVLFEVGLAQALSHWLGESAYLANLGAGTLILGSVALITWIAVARLSRSELAKKVAKYERIQREHAARFGNTAADPQASAAAERG